MADGQDIYAGLTRVIGTTTTYNEHTFDTYGYYLIEADHGVPEPQSVTVEIPYADHQLDFTKWHGRVFHKTRTLSYTFARRYPTPTERVQGRDEFVQWLWAIQGEWVSDDSLRHYPWWHDVCCKSVTTEEHPLSGLVTVKCEFSAFPYHAVARGTTPPATDGTGMNNWRL